MPKIFETPIYIERSPAASDAHLLIAADQELILESWSATEEEIEEIVRRVNAYDGLVELVREYALCDGRISNVADAGILAGRVSAAAAAKLKELGEEP